MVYNTCLGQKFFTIGLPAECVPTRSRDKDKEAGAKLSNKSGSFLKFISLVQILVFVYHAKQGLTASFGEDGPSDVFSEVK